MMKMIPLNSMRPPEEVRNETTKVMVIYIHLSEGCEQAGKCGCLNKTLYGLKQSARNSTCQPFCIQKDYIFILVYVDDIFILRILTKSLLSLATSLNLSTTIITVLYIYSLDGHNTPN